MASSSKGFVAQPTESYEIHTTDERDMLRMGRVQQLKVPVHLLAKAILQDRPG